MKTIKQFINSITESDKIQIISEYKQFTADGYIGESLLRSYAKECAIFMGDENGAKTHITSWMLALCNELLMYFTDKYLESI